MDIHLRTSQASTTLRLGQFTRFVDGSGCQVMLDVVSRGFAARRPFYFEVHALANFLDGLRAMDRSLTGSAMLKPSFEDDFIEFTMAPRGRVIVRGELFELSEHSQHLQFEFETDQTVLKPLIDDLTLVSSEPPR
jgi:hypothetical protein